MKTNNFNHDILSLRNNLKSFALGLTRDSSDADDLIQESYLKALLYKEKFEENTNMKAWMMTIMKNTFINTYRKEKRENTYRDNTVNDYFLNSSVRQGFDSTDSMLTSKEILGEIERLDSEFKEPFQLFTSGFKYKEIAEKLEIPIGTVKSRIFLTRQKLSENLKDFAV